VGRLLLRPRIDPILLAFVLMASSLVRALPIAATLPGNLTEAFGPAQPRSTKEAPARPRAIVLSDLFLGVHSPNVKIQTLPYSSHGRSLEMDLYTDGKAAEHPLVLVIHGGSWASGRRGELPELNRYLAARGYLVASIDYRLAPADHFPAPIEDVQAAISDLTSHAKEVGFDAKNIVLLGRSAGGQIALFTAYQSADPRIRGVISFYAPADMVMAYALPSNPLIINSRRVLRNYVGSDHFPEAYQAASPLDHVGPKAPPTLIIHGGRDEMVWVTHSEHLSQRLKEFHRPVYFLRLPWATHGADYIFRGPGGQLSTYAVERFLAAVIRVSLKG